MTDFAWREAIWPAPAKCEDILVDCMRLVTTHLQALGSDRKVAPTLDRTAIRARLAAFDFDAPCSTADAARAIAELLDAGLVQSANARCFGLFNPTPALPGIVGDVLAAAWNPQLAVWSHA